MRRTNKLEEKIARKRCELLVVRFMEAVADMRDDAHFSIACLPAHFAYAYAYVTRCALRISQHPLPLPHLLHLSLSL